MPIVGNASIEPGNNTIFNKGDCKVGIYSIPSSARPLNDQAFNTGIVVIDRNADAIA